MVKRNFTNEELSEMLYKAQKTQTTIDIISEIDSGLTIDDAYDIQLLNVKRALGDGEIITGKKIGLTSKGMQDLLGITEPDYGHLYASMGVENGGRVFIDSQGIRPKVEGEVAFILKEDLKGPGVSLEDVYKATDYICASIEIVDSRIKDWKIKLVDTIADNGSSSLYVLGDAKVKLDKLSLPDIEMTLYKNGEEVNRGKGSDVLGNPAASVAWLANKLCEYGIYLKKGEIVLSGAFTASPEAFKGDIFECQFTELGSVKVEFK